MVHWTCFVVIFVVSSLYSAFSVRATTTTTATTTLNFNISTADDWEKISRWEKYNVTYVAPLIDHLLLPQPLPHIVVFIHAAVDTFVYKRRGKEYSVEGLDILMEILHCVINSSLHRKVDGIYITALGSWERRSQLRSILNERYLSINYIHIVAESSNLNLVCHLHLISLKSLKVSLIFLIFYLCILYFFRCM